MHSPERERVRRRVGLAPGGWRGYGMVKFGLCLAMTLILAACVTGPIQLDMRYPEGAVSQSPAAEVSSTPSPACGVKIDSITDARGNKRTLGHIGAASVYGEKVDDWVRRALTDLSALGYRVDATSQPDVRMDITLKQAYIQNVLTSVESAVRLTVRYTRVGKATVERSYRGGYVRVNWASAANELMGALNNAMVRVVRDISKDLPEFCGK